MRKEREWEVGGYRRGTEGRRKQGGRWKGKGNEMEVGRDMGEMGKEGCRRNGERGKLGFAVMCEEKKFRIRKKK